MNPLLEALHDALGTECPEDRSILDRFDWEAAGIETRYIVCITPRSGSTWLRTLLGSTKLCGDPGEFFREPAIRRDTRRLDASSFAEYFARRVNLSQSESTFGFEINFGRLAMFTELVDMESVFLTPGTRFVSMFRRDLLAQAISVVSAIQSGVWHRTKNGASKTRSAASKEGAASAPTDLDDGAVWWWILNMLREEHGWAAFFNRYGLTPLHIDYEDLVTATHYQILRFLRHVKGSRIELDSVLMNKLAGLKNDTQRLANELSWRVWSRFTFDYFDELEAVYRERSTLDLQGFRETLVSNYGLRIAKLASL